MTKQNQEVGNESIAVQGRDVIVQVGIKPEECKELIHSALIAALPMYRAVAEDVANQRMLILEDKIAERISREPDVKPEALQDPDFQYIVTKAHHAYARRGDEQIADTLVDLIADRAKQVEHTRLTLSLNDAVETVAALTKNEFAELSLIYLLRLTRNNTVRNYDTFLVFLSETILPFVDDISEGETSYLYLEARNCGSITSFMSVELRNLIMEKYGGVLSNGTTKENLKNHLPPEWQHILDDPKVIVPCLHNSDLWQTNAVDQNTFMENSKKLGMPDEVATNVWNGNAEAFWTQDQMIERVGAKLPAYVRLNMLWSSTVLRSFRLSTVGIAIAHANARRVIKINPDLGIWID